MSFFKNKLNVVLVIVLSVLICVGTVLGIKVASKPKVIVDDFTMASEEDVMLWAVDNKVVDSLILEHQNDDSIEKGKVIYQSIKGGDKLSGTLTVVVSDGPDVKNTISIPIETFKTKTDAENWFSQNKFLNVKYEYENIADSSKDEDSIISISKTSATREDEILVKIATHKNIDVPDFSKMSDDRIDEWSKENGVTVKIEYAASSFSKGTYLKQSIQAGEKTSAGSTIVVSLSSGDDKTVSVPATYLGIGENEFLLNIQKLGFTKVEKDSNTYYSVSSKKGTIFSYDDGQISTDKTIKYALSEGKYEYTKGQFDNMELSKVQALIKTLNDRNAHITLNTTDVSTTDYANGYVYNCSSSFKEPYNTTISCSLAKNGNSTNPTVSGKTGYIDPNYYLGKSEDKFKNDLKKEGFTNVQKGESIFSNLYSDGTICYYLPDGTQDLSTKIIYKVSLGKFDASKFNSKTVNEANNVIASYNNKGASLKLSTTNKETSSYDSETLFDCSLSGSTVSCKLAVSKSSEPEPEQPSTDPVEETGDILAFAVLQNTKVSSSYEETKNLISSYFSKFTNVTVQEGNSDEYDAGIILSISVDGNTSYLPGSYKVSTPIVITIDSHNER